MCLVHGISLPSLCCDLSFCQMFSLHSRSCVYRNILYEGRELCAVFWFFGRLTFKTSLYSQQACIQDRLVFKTGLCIQDRLILQCCILVTITRSHYYTRMCTQCPVHHTHYLCRVCSRGLYSRVACVQRSQWKRRLYSRQAYIQGQVSTRPLRYVSQQFLWMRSFCQS